MLTNVEWYVVKRRNQFLVGCPYDNSFIRYSNSPWDAFKTKNFHTALRVAREIDGKVMKLNTLLHEYSAYIIGRMGLPYHKREISIISVALDAPQDTISALTGRIGKLDGVSVKTAYAGAGCDAA